MEKICIIRDCENPGTEAIALDFIIVLVCKEHHELIEKAWFMGYIDGVEQGLQERDHQN